MPSRPERRYKLLTDENSRMCEWHGKRHSLSRFNEADPSCRLAMKKVAKGQLKPKASHWDGKRRGRGPRFYRLTRPTQTAMDTETYRGQLKVICTPTEFFEPNGNIEDLLRWIVNNGAEVVWFWNLRFDSDVILRMIFEAVDIMNTKNKEKKLMFLEDHCVQVGVFTVTLIGAKSFRVETESQRVDCFDACAFYTKNEVRQTLDAAARVMLGEGKIAAQLGIDRKLIGTVEGYYEEHREKIIEYCKQDSNLTLQLGEMLVDTAQQALGVYPKRWSSAASMAKAWLEKNHPELIARSKKSDKFFRHSFRGGLFVTRVLGRVKNQTEADITNAYGTALTRLISLDGLVERHGPTRSSDAVYGAYIIDVPYDGLLPWRLSDIGIRAPTTDKDKPNEKILYPESNPGEMNAYCATKSELEYFDEEGIEYRVLWADELCGTPKGLAFPDFPALVQRVVNLKKEAETDPRAALLRECLKRVVNSTYGSLAESKHGETPLTTWPLAAEITASCRITIWREWRRVERAEGLVVSVNTDSLRYVPGKYTVPVAHGELGKFDNKFVGHTATHYQSGVAMIEHPADCGCSDEKQARGADRVLRADDGLGATKAYPLETKRQARERIAHPPAPHEEGGLEIHAASCPCPRCALAPRPLLRKRGMPSLAPVDLLKASGTEIEIVSKRPIHAIEGIIQDRMDDVADIPESADDIAADDGTRRRSLSVLSNLKSAVYDPKDLTFPRLNAGPVVGRPIPMDALLDFTWIREAIGKRRQIEEMYDYEDPVPGTVV